MDARPTDVRSMADALQQAHPVAASVTLRISDCVIRVDVSAAALRDALADYFQPFLAGDDAAAIEVSVLQSPMVETGLSYQVYPPGPGKTRIKDEYADLVDGRVLRKRATGMVFLFGGAVNVAAGPCLENLNQVINFINNRYIQRLLDRGSLLCHAAGVARGHAAGMGIAGRSGGGKSTLALRLLSRGLDFVSNDRLLLDKSAGGVTMRGLAKFPRVNPGSIMNNANLTGLLAPATRRALVDMPEDQLWVLEDKHDVPIHRHYGPERIRPDAPLRALVVLNWRRGGGAAALRDVRLDERRDLLETIIKSPGAHYYNPNGSGADSPLAQAYVDCLAGCRVAEIVGGIDFSWATDACRELLAD